MFISVNRALLRQCCWYTLASAFTALFGAVYEHFSHEVYSNFMIYAFAIPLVLGTLPLLGLLCSGKTVRENSWGLRLYGFGIATWTTGSILKGVLEIYGTTSHWMPVYFIAGLILFLLGIGTFIRESLTDNP